MNITDSLRHSFRIIAYSPSVRVPIKIDCIFGNYSAILIRIPWSQNNNILQLLGTDKINKFLSIELVCYHHYYHYINPVQYFRYNLPD